MTRFRKFKRESYASWNMPATEEERNDLLKTLETKITNHKCNTNNGICKKCKKWRKEINLSKHIWKNAHHTAKQRFAATCPGLIHGLWHEYQDNWKIFCRYKNSYGTIKSEQYDVSTAYVVTQFGKDFAAYALQNSNDKEKNYINTLPILIIINGKTLKN